jgi:hypothetical protein
MLGCSSDTEVLTQQTDGQSYVQVATVVPKRAENSPPHTVMLSSGRMCSSLAKVAGARTYMGASQTWLAGEMS